MIFSKFFFINLLKYCISKQSFSLLVRKNENLSTKNFFSRFCKSLKINFFQFLAYNSNSSEYRRKKYKQKLTYFEQKCELINYLYNETTIKYKDPSKRTEEYNAKLENFFSLKENVPTMNWLA